MDFVIDASKLDDNVVMQLFQRRNTYGERNSKGEKLFLAREKITADSSPRELAHAFYHLWRSLIHFVRDDPYRPDPEKEDVIDEHQRLIHLQGMIASTVPAIEAAKLLLRRGPNGDNRDFVLQELESVQTACEARSQDEHFNSVLKEKSLPTAGELYCSIIDHKLPQVIRDRLDWAEFNLNIGTTTDFVLGELEQLLPSSTPIAPLEARRKRSTPHRPHALPSTQGPTDQALEA